jgi:urate oxidase
MSVQILRQSYGKHRVRVSKIKRPRHHPAKDESHQFMEVSVDIELDGDFHHAYTQQDNRQLIATDTCRNIVYILAKKDPMHSIESFGCCLATHFIDSYPQVEQALIRVREHRWNSVEGSGHVFTGGDSETPTVEIVAVRDKPLQIEAGIEHWSLAKTTESGFENFHRDQYRTLCDTSDRILATSLTAGWRYATCPDDYLAARSLVRKTLLQAFMNHYSYSVQDTLYRMAKAALTAEASLDSIHLVMPNLHHLRFPLEPFGFDNDNEVFVVTDEPFGYISATVSRM